jgi:hypothetical protein
LAENSSRLKAFTHPVYPAPWLEFTPRSAGTQAGGAEAPHSKKLAGNLGPRLGFDKSELNLYTRKKMPPQLQTLPAAPASEANLTEIIRERNRWFFALEVERKEEKLFELEVMLKGLDRFFNLQNQPISERDAIVSRDFKNELRILRDSVFRVVVLCRTLLPDSDARALHFQNYVESRLLNDHQRAQNIERALRQNSPEESLYVLCHSFVNFHELLNRLMELDRHSYSLFYHIEQLLSREITGNHYFNPFRAAGFAPHYDVIRSARLSRLIRQLNPPEVKKQFSLLFLLLYKLLKYLHFVETERLDLDRLKDSLLIFALINSESQYLIDLLERDLPNHLRSLANFPPARLRVVSDLFDSTAYQLGLEIKKIFELELRDAAAGADLNHLRAGATRSKGLLTNIFQQTIVALAQVLDPELVGRDLFPDFISRLEQSIRLRRDIWLFHKALENLEQIVAESEPKAESIAIMEAVKTLRNFIFYYQNISFQFVRCYDRDYFQEFFDYLDAFNLADVEVPFVFQEFKRSIHSFKLFLETTLSNINNRTELHNLPFGTEEGERIFAQFLQ